MFNLGNTCYTVQYDIDIYGLSPQIGQSFESVALLKFSPSDIF